MLLQLLLLQHLLIVNREVVLWRRSQRLLPVHEVGQLDVLFRLLIHGLCKFVAYHSSTSAALG